ncbi:MAG: T9SS type A sorting domain-containing protein [Candidatus Cloacimonetes bacterium]|nr:T9SS type A sorting domain-containing protein [Candidatus Cloacimonadota bacterium]
MYRVIVLTICLVWLSFALSAYEITYSDAWFDQGFSLSSRSDDGVDITFSITNFSIDDVVVDNDTLQKVNLRGMFLPNNEGAPDLPSDGRWIALPQGSEPVFTIKANRYETYENIELAPAPRIPFETEDGPLEYTFDESIYSIDANYPELPVLLSESTQLRGVDAVILGITPYQYNPVTKTLIVYRDLHVRVDFIGGNGHFGEDRLRSLWWDPIHHATFMNSESLPDVEYPVSTNRTLDYEYLIIIPDNNDYLTLANELALFRTRQGIRTGVVTTADIGGNSANDIESYINNAVGDWDVPPVAVLLIGDWGSGNTQLICPSYTYEVDDNTHVTVSDNFYADVNGDHLPDVAIARMTANNASQLSIMINKSMNYEISPPTNPGFYDNPVFAGGWQTNRWFILCTEICRGFFENELGKTPVREYAICEGSPGSQWSTASNTYAVVDNFGYYGLGYIPQTPEGLTDWGGNASRLNTDINNGAFLVLHRDHGSVYGWGEPDYDRNDLSNLQNNDLSYFLSINCNTGKFSIAGDCFAEALHRYEDRALGVIAAAQISCSYVNDTFVWGMFDFMWPEFDPFYNSPGCHNLLPSFANVYGKIFLESSSWPSNPDKKRTVYYLFHAHGDAFTRLYEEIPQYLTVEHAGVINESQDCYDVTAVYRAHVALLVNDEIISSGVCQYGSNVTLHFEPQPLGTEIELVVTAQNYYTYRTTIPVTHDVCITGTVNLEGGDDENVSVYLYDGAGTQYIGSTTTNSEGEFQFTEIPYGDYQLKLSSYFDTGSNPSEARCYYPKIENINVPDQPVYDVGVIEMEQFSLSSIIVNSDPEVESFKEVQDACDFLEDFDICCFWSPITANVYVVEGEYDYFSFEALSDVHVTVRGFDNHTCIINGTVTQPGILLGNNTNSSITLRNLTIQNSHKSGVAIDRFNESIGCQYTLTDLTIQNNSVRGLYPYNDESIDSGGGVFSRSPVTITNCLITNNHGMYESGGWYTYGWGLGGGVYILNNSNEVTTVQNCTISENSSRNAGAIYCEGSGAIVLDGNRITQNTLQLPRDTSEEPGHCMGIWAFACEELSIQNNLIDHHERYSQSGGTPLRIQGSSNTQVVNNTIVDNPQLNGLRLFDTSDCHIMSNIFLNNLSPISSSSSGQTVQYCCWYNYTEPSTFGGGYVPDATNITDDPQLTTSTDPQPYSPIWNSTTRSPVIDAGHPNMSDPDDTPSDMGAIRAMTHKQETYIARSGHTTPGELYYNWVCFPVIDDLYTADNAAEDFFPPLYPSLEALLYQWNAAEIIEDEWTYPDAVDVVPVNGYKISVNSTIDMVKSGFLADPDTEIELTESTTHWVGYFIEESQKPLDALDGVLEFLSEIKHRDWCLNKVPGGSWIGDIGEYTLNYGDMVELTCDEACSFSWTDNLEPEDPKTKGALCFFPVDEDPDYIPIYLDMNGYGDNLPQEIGMYADDELIGATVVENMGPQVNAYIDDIEDLEDKVVTFELYYGERSPVQVCDEYTVKSSATSVFVSTNRLFETESTYYQVNLGDGSGTPDVPAVAGVSSFPNPFNPSTTIRCALPQDGNVSVRVYNARGQLVRTLVDGDMPAGYHEIVWDGRDNHGSAIGSGVYLCRLQTGSATLTHKLLLLK